MQAKAKVTIKGQVTIPKKIREKLNIRPSDFVLFVRKGNEVVIKPARTLLDLRGVIKTDKKIEDWEKVRDNAKKYVINEVMENL
ncbi:MAG: AbrB/MazE/SpoVT family DNA-binding domain-containing protein [Desulfobacterales bacterium]|uniref:AbrB/MazE/SpoVT family DNA-binding domain-containing protein n=1 Tax=Candidatus Desulfatibia vada TaxID=2841696 RepID=A0A8J6TUH5_9BACT|nr:AbrB/MazE/SpoVT family DNA-binding domain-containing protein [Candidatus Desulfatibia vada]MBL6971610.1 AbrB/MazE/SpoVT family DNA-binding domain-containing protein [Desulfobacterales bacterium]